MEVAKTTTILNKNVSIDNTDIKKKVVIMTPQEKKDEEIYKEEQEITHEIIEPEKEKYLPGEKLLKKLNRSKRGRKRVKKNAVVHMSENSNDEEQLNDADIARLITLLKKRQL
jgi:hypothetical protein